MTTLKKRLCFLKPFLTPFDIYFYNNHIRYTTSFLDFSRLITCMCTGKAVFSTLRKGYIPETRARARVRACVYVCFFKTLLISIFISIPSDIQSYPIYNLFSRFFALRNTRAGHDGQYWDDSIRKRRRPKEYKVEVC